MKDSTSTQSPSVSQETQRLLNFLEQEDKHVLDVELVEVR